MATTRIAELATQVAENTKRVDEYLRQHELPSPSFDAEGPVDFCIRSEEIQRARSLAIDGATELADLLRGPKESLQPVNPTSLQVIHRFDIARKVPIGGEITFKDLAKQCDLYEPDLRRIIRFAISFHRLFQEPRRGFVTHSAASRKLAEDQDFHDALGLVFNEFVPSYGRTVDALEQFKDQEPSQTGFALVQNTTQPFFEAKQFAGAMKAFNAIDSGHSPVFLAQGYPWDSINGTVVDVGGSKGHISILLAKSFPRLHFIVQDLPKVIEGAKSKLDASIADRVTFQGRDFFTPQTVVADAYLFRWIFHNWPDKYVVAILRTLVPVMKTGARVIVNELLNPPSNSLSLSSERSIRSLDMIMLSMHNSREREAEEWQDLFLEADPRFGVLKIWTPIGASLAIIEAVWQE
ncbi:putative o- protein [Botrytis fragariae]|uniref:Putative o- protein n=1 Tax=Botrytis fragariae TaxID=1964551 RepID=A0A8H6EG67_9HELO|nr:putative o- protein [Botrytis fragariae]KAF5870961.1 putative o- protein [Botrytis fragariae]